MTEGTTAINRSQERPASTRSGYLMLFIWLGLLLWGIWSFLAFAASTESFSGPNPLWMVSLILSAVIGLLILLGFFMIQPNMSAVITLFGEYKGTERSQGLRWIWFWMGKKKISVRQHNVHSERVKVNDLRGNPIE